MSEFESTETVAEWANAEIARFRAEAEKQHQKARFEAETVARLRAEVERLTAPTPVMSGGVVDWKAAYEFEYKRANEAERERDEALAQVAVLMTLKERGFLPGEDINPHKAAADEARALLDRLQRAEAVVEQVKQCSIAHELCGPLTKGLAEWEEGKA